MPALLSAVSSRKKRARALSEPKQTAPRLRWYGILAEGLELANPHRYRVRTLPSTGALLRAEDTSEQQSLL